MLIHNAVITGSLTYNGVDISDITGSEASISALNSFSASMLNYTASNNLASASFSTRVVNLESTASVLTTASASFAIVSQSYASASGSLSTRVTNTETTASSLVTASGSFSTRVTNLELTGSSLVAASASFSTRVVSLESTASVLTTASASFAQQSGSNSTRLTNLESTASVLTTASASFAVVSSSYASASGSLSTRVTTIEGSYATTGSNVFVGNQGITSLSNAISFTSTGSLYTDGGLRITKDMYVSGTAFFNNVTIYGTQSVNYITSSQLNIGTNIITVNTDTPTVRYGGIAVYDSGSTGLTGSLLWDSEQNHWIYTNPSGSTYSGGMMISGPRASARGCEVGTTSCALMMGQGGDHITSSAILHYSNATCFYGNTTITSTGVGCFAGAVCASSVASAGTITGTSGAFSSTLSSNSDFTVNTNRFIVNAATGNTSVAGTLNVTGQACASSVLSSGTICSTGNTCFGGMSVVASCLGIGTATPNQKLQVYDATVARILVGTNTTFTDPYSAFPAQNISAIQVISSNVGGAQLQLGYTNTCSGCGIGGIHFMTTGTSASEKRGALIASELEASSATNVTANLVFYTNITGTIGERMRIASTGQVCFACTICAPMVLASGCVGIGTTSPQSALSLAGTSTISIATTDGSDNSYMLISGGGAAAAGRGAYIVLNGNDRVTYGGQLDLGTGDSGNAYMTFSTAGSERMRITNAGIACFACQVCAPNVSIVNCLGVGTAPGAGYILDVYQPASSTTAYARIKNNRSRNAALQLETNCGNFLVGVGIGTDTNRFMIYDNNAGATRLTLDDSGNLGLGVTPSAWGSSYKAMQISSGAAFYGITSDVRYAVMSANNFNNGTQDTYIGNGASTLYVQGIGQHIWYNAPAGAPNCAISFTQAMTLDTSGNLGIGVTSTGGSAADKIIGVEGTNSGQINLRYNGTSGAYFYSNSVNTVLSSVQAIPLLLNTTNIERLRITSTGIACFACQVCVPRLQVFNTSSIIVVEGTATNGEGTVTIAGKNSSGTSRSAVFKYDNADIIRIGTADAITMRFETSDVTRLCITSTGIAVFSCQVCAPVAIISGCVGIGTTSLISTLTVSCSVSSRCFTGIIVENFAGAGSECARAGIAFKGYDWVQGGIWHGRNGGAFDGALVFGTNPDTSNLTVGGLCTRLVFTNAGIATFSCQICAAGLRSSANVTINKSLEGLTVSGGSSGDATYMSFQANSQCGWLIVGAQGSVANYIQTGTAACESAITTVGAFALGLGTNQIERMRITSTGIACFACQACFGGRVSTISTGVDNTFADAFVGVYSGNNNEQNAIQTAVSSNAAGSGFLFMVSCGAGLSTRSCGYKMVRNGHTFYTDNTARLSIDSSGNVLPGANGTQDLGSSSFRWCTVYTSDLSLSNGIGDYTIVEGENDLFLYNNNSCKVFKFLLQEVCPEIAPAKRSL